MNKTTHTWISDCRTDLDMLQLNITINKLIQQSNTVINKFLSNKI